MKKSVITLLTAAGLLSVLSGCAVYVPDAPVVVAPQGGPGNGFCPPGQAKKGRC
ncbi:hypothetical protein [Burkholderia ubonensis]|uniref:Lipoprotein n=1 Tax=Burkholderia ubonensis TaxID=101571 RepID=A0AB74DFA2_9BURK|nr:hypothetical protein [Burkholderia ubonensis]AYZ66779.1 hypothetical protein EGY31_26920 [Burkholderia multivorans]MDY7786995.1 hypothetical protein [Burkholderia ubonensis]PAJ80600.1 hypothetical protein CJO71_11610 [Burkholderia ubonensis]PAJ84385.1 hypothetical protein CJO70_28170 [Burkholderia ubonensis]PAJ91251.1 hypothetical protein CJO69_28060 [Burkholderia ubonensis]